jgi:putative integral membrane protein (TIGR02587 family)
MSLREYGRGIAGGLIFSLPLLYTMEVWWFGFIVDPKRLIIYILATFVLLLGYNRYAGLHEDASWLEVAIDSIEEMGIGLVLATLFLVLLGRITSDMPSTEVVGKIVMEAMTVAIGVSVGTAQLGAAGGEDETGMDGDGGVQLVSVKHELVLAFCGAVLFAGNIAPTDEIVVVGSEVSAWNLLGMAGLSLLLASLILFYSDFVGTHLVIPKDLPYQLILARSVTTYCVALVAAALILWFFGRFDGVTPISAISQTLVLGVAATLGASAGRLLIQ